MATPEQVRAAVDRYVQTFSSGDRDGWLANFATDAVHVDPATAPPNVGREAIGAFWDNTYQLTEKIDLDVHDVIVAGNEAVMVFTINARGAGGGVQIDAVDVFEIDDDGHICGMKAYFDPTRMRPLEPPG